MKYNIPEHRESGLAYLANPPTIATVFSCNPEIVSVDSGRRWRIPPLCGLPGHACGFWMPGHDPGDEDRG
jgi:hypothetical protein